MKGRSGKDARRKRAIERHEAWISSLKKMKEIPEEKRESSIKLFEEVIENTKKNLGLR